MKKVLLITNIPNPYRLPLFNELNKQFHAAGYLFKVVFSVAGYSRRKFTLKPEDFQFDHIYLNKETYKNSSDENVRFTYPGLWQYLKNEKPDFIITSGYSTPTIIAFWYKIFFKTPYFIWNGGYPASSAKETFIKRFIRSQLTKSAHGCIAYGHLSAKYMQSLGADSSRIFIAINTVDTAHFKNQADKIKQHLSKDNKTHLLYVGYLTSRKNVLKLIQAIKPLLEQKNNIILDIVGDGDERTNLENYVSNNNMTDKIIFHGFIQKDELTRYYIQSACLLFQTDFDIWGLVLVEAMASGLPVLCSQNAGAAHDLIEEGKNGLIVNFDDTTDVQMKLNLLLDNPKRLKDLGENAQSTIENKATIKISAQGFIQAIANTDRQRNEI